MLIRVPLSWLREYVDVAIPVNDLALRLHMSGTEVKGIERKAWKDIWVGEIAALDKHPNANKLQLATVDYGNGRRKQVVTGGDDLKDARPSGLDVRIEDANACPRFAAARLDGVKIGPSPKWMQERLLAAGMRPISNVVDVTNYVMLELGQPLHAYDLRDVRGGTLVARQAREGERIRTLDSVERALPRATLVIADEQRSLGVAGIMGGEDSEIRSDTSSIALECASFEPRGIGRTATALEMRGSSGSAAARRFAWELSPDLVPIALARAVSLLREHAGARYAGTIDRYPRPRPLPQVRLAFAKIGRHLGIEVDPAETLDILRRLQFTAAADSDTLVATPPVVRTDIAIAEDIVEEVGRIAGYDRLPIRVPDGPLPLAERHPLE